MINLDILKKLETDLKYYSKDISQGPWRRGIGDEYRQIFDNQGSLVAERCGARDGTLIVQLHNDLPLFLEIISMMIKTLEKQA